MREKREQKRKTQKTWPCPEAGYLRDRNIKRVGVWTGDGYANAERMLKRAPAKFYRILGWADADAEAEPIQMQVAKAKSEADRKHKEKAQKSLRAPSD